MRVSWKFAKIKAGNLREKEFEALDCLNKLDDKTVNIIADNDELEKYEKVKRGLEEVEAIKGRGPGCVLEWTL